MMMSISILWLCPRKDINLCKLLIWSLWCFGLRLINLFNLKFLKCCVFFLVGDGLDNPLDPAERVLRREGPSYSNQGGEIRAGGHQRWALAASNKSEVPIENFSHFSMSKKPLNRKWASWPDGDSMFHPVANVCSKRSPFSENFLSLWYYES